MSLTEDCIDIHFKNKCDEVPDLELGDNTVKMFLNTKGTIQNDEPDELIHF